MDKRDKHLAVWEWLISCPEIKNMFFNFSEGNTGDTVIIPDSTYNDDIIRSFADGSCERYYTFTIVRFQRFSVTANDVENIETLIDIEKIADWVEAQNDIGNYPEFPGGDTINNISVLPFANGGLAGSDNESAKYMFSVQIEYLHEKG